MPREDLINVSTLSYLCSVDSFGPWLHRGFCSAKEKVVSGPTPRLCDPASQLGGGDPMIGCPWIRMEGREESVVDQNRVVGRQSGPLKKALLISQEVCEEAKHMLQLTFWGEYICIQKLKRFMGNRQQQEFIHVCCSTSLSTLFHCCNQISKAAFYFPWRCFHYEWRLLHHQHSRHLLSTCCMQNTKGNQSTVKDMWSIAPVCTCKVLKCSGEDSTPKFTLIQCGLWKGRIGGSTDFFF